MKRDFKRVVFSYEHGDETLPHIKDLVSEIEDPEKSKILSYLRMNCIAACPGVIYDLINPDRVIGFGNAYSDGIYYWRDEFINYVDRYNIPVPAEFREHILKNYQARAKRHVLLRLIDCVEIKNNPYLGYTFNIKINKNGIIEYKNNIDCYDGVVLRIKSDRAKYIIDPIMTELFCYDSDNHGTAIIDGYHWEVLFYRKNELVDKVEGWPDEDDRRHSKIKRVIEFVERFVPKDLGSRYMQ